MGKPTGFMEYQRKTGNTVAPLERIKNFKEFHLQLPKKEQQMQAARCMACGVPFCQAGTMIAGMASGCPLQNLVPEWNDLVYLGNYEQAYRRLTKTKLFSGIYLPRLPGTLRSSLYMQRKRRPGLHEGK